MNRRLNFMHFGTALVAVLVSISWVYAKRAEPSKPGGNIVDKDTAIDGSSRERRIDAAIAIDTDVNLEGPSMLQRTMSSITAIMGLPRQSKSATERDSWVRQLLRPHAAQSILPVSIVSLSHDQLLLQTDSPQSPSFKISSTVVQTQPGALREEWCWTTVLCVPGLLWAVTSDRTGPLTVIACYMFASIAMNILNKEAASNFKATFLLVLIQMAVADAVILFMEGRKMSCGQWTDLLKWSVVPVFFAGMLATSMWALKEATLSAVLILKNLLPIISFGAEKFLFNTPPSVTSSMIISLLVTFAGTILYGYADASVTALGKVLIVINCCFTLLDRLVQTYFLKLSKDFSLSVPMCMILNNTLGAIPLMGLAIGMGEVKEWGGIVAGTSSLTWFWVVMSSGVGACLGYAGLRTQKLVSGTTVLVLQNVNKILLLYISSAALGDRLQTAAWIGCTVSLIGCLWYSLLRLPGETKQPADGGNMEKHLVGASKTGKA